MQRPNHPVTRRDLFRSTKVCDEIELKERASRSLLPSDDPIDDMNRPHSSASTSSAVALRSTPARGYTNVLMGGANPMVYTCMHADSELREILKEIRVITAKMRQDDEDANVVSDWQFAAMVVDRICLFSFTIFTIASTVLSLGSAPHLMA
ncbi:hypothetical protein JTE90_015766 [Oedothorax gibbosus]|uniref:Neurotransmitter-gated ion-channel transmembrane domain-containing protein n=1 Tax=Oedothorax gibbosus TaxID=931172 RepID=A0AAV6VZ79_9ARAC|nr:hypothetical protein JTE90_015766 [Oedothorax gibbosus]